MYVANYFKELKKNSLLILPDKESAAYFQNDLANLLVNDKTLFFPSSYQRSALYEKTDTSSIVLRTEVLNKITQKGKNYLIVTYPEALLEKVISRKQLEKQSLEVKVGESLSTDFIIEILNDYEFERVNFVHEPGQFSVRGSIIDIFSFSNEDPYRVDFFGDDIESIRTFDIENQLSKEKLKKVYIIPNIQDQAINENYISFLDFIPSRTAVWVKDLKFCKEKVNDVFYKTINKYNETEDKDEKQNPEEILINGDTLLSNLKNFKVVEFGNKSFAEIDKQYNFSISTQPAFSKNFDLLISNLMENQHNGYHNILLSDNVRQIERLDAIFRDKGADVKFSTVETALHEGFVDSELRICCYTDHQIFERYHKFKLKTKFSNKESISLKELTGLNPGDYVVHSDHGIGKFGGLQKIDVNGKAQETIRLIYKDNDVLYVSIHALHRISKYKGKEGAEPKIYKLGSGAWQKLKQTTKKKVKDIAKELIALYAKRKQEKALPFSPDTFMQTELEASFIYEDTPDQLKATKAFKEDMESDIPMDRLVCGDVGFGKTEIAIRAAFKAVADSKQVAILVPTTILALQHFNTFSARLKDFPCNVEYISRLKSTKQQKEILKKVENGEVDILIGTHRIAGKDVKFKDLGLLIVDEEQKFGVSVKEKLKQMKANVDTLTLTATPIPRTLQFSLMGARDLSIINTPPPNRHPILTEIHTFSEDIIREAINYELDRNGQVFFIHNRVQNIHEVEAMIKRICPHAKTIVAHGQMEGPKLEKIMLEFIDGYYDVLIATTIIESGLDIPNANTIIINNANNFGLSDLHQLRGRVGRSNKKAFAYLLAPPLTHVSSEARRRLRAIEEFSELGSGFNISLQDLDIRGAGNLLGGEQSGFIADIGFETYHKILNEAIQELKENEYKDLYSEQTNNDQFYSGTSIPTDLKFVTDCQIDTDLEVLFPDDYIENISERIKLYRELDNIQNEEGLKKFEIAILDRFGEIPKQTLELFNVVRLRWIAIELGFEKIILKNRKMVGYFVANQQSPFYQSPIFSKVLQFMQFNPSICNMKEIKNKLTLSFENIKDLQTAIDKFKLIDKDK